MIRAVLLTLAILGAAAPGAAAQAVPAQDERTVSPYLLLGGSLDLVERGDRYEALARIAEAAGDYPRAARHFTLACQSRAAQLGGSFETAPCRRARTLAREHQVLDVEVNLLVSEGTGRAWRLDIVGAVATLQQALKLGATLNPDLPDGAPLTGAHHMLGAILLETGRFDVSLQELTYARDHCGVAGNATCVAYASIWLCRLHTRIGDYAAARSACDAAQASVKGDVLVLANLGWIRAGLEKALDRHEPALASLQGSWQAAQLRGAEALRPALAHAIADALVTVGRLDEAEVWQQQIERAATGGQVGANYSFVTALRRGEIALARGRLDDAIAAFESATGSPQHEVALGSNFALARARKQRGDLAGAREALERAIAKIEAGRINLSGATLRASYLNLHATAYRELIGIRWDADGNAAAPAALEIAEAGRARALLDSLKSAQVAGAAAPTLSAQGVQATLGPADVLVEYISSRDRLFAITVTRDRISMVPLPLAGTAEQLGRRVDFFSALVQESSESALGPSARRLYADVLAPALADLPAAARTLIIAADGPLFRLPFDALMSPAPLIDRWDIVTLPSASSLASRVRREVPTAAALVVAAPTVTAGLSPLPAAQNEAAAIRRRVGGDVNELSGAGATEAQLTAGGLGRFAVLHFASHAVVDETTPLRSALMLAPGDSGADGRWNAEEIYRTPINADLVVLSACSTAAGALSPGEGAMSLSRAFLYAGAGATVATLWDVPDAPGPVFADVLYRELAAGRPLGAAVAGARRELRRRGAPPRAWAAYVLTGNPGATVGITPRTDPWSWSLRLAGGLAVVLALIAVVIFFTRTWANIRWPAPAAAAVVAAIVAAVVAQWPLRGTRLDGDVTRGDAAVIIEPVLSNGRLVWMPVPAADEHTVDVFDADGLPVARATGVASPYAMPPATGGWIRVAARHQGQLIAQSVLVRFPKGQ